jgi:hypothetical protein
LRRPETRRAAPYAEAPPALIAYLPNPPPVPTGEQPGKGDRIVSETFSTPKSRSKSRCGSAPSGPRHVDLILGAIHVHQHGAVAIDRHGNVLGTYASTDEAIAAIANALRGGRR